MSSGRPDLPILFLDASLGGHVVAGALREAGAKVITHLERFPEGTPDAVWLREAGLNGWLVLTKDSRIRYREIEKQALRRAGVRAFVLTAKNLTGLKMAEAFVRALPRIYRLAGEGSGWMIARVTASGEVEVLEPARKRARRGRR